MGNKKYSQQEERAQGNRLGMFQLVKEWAMGVGGEVISLEEGETLRRLDSQAC